MSSPTTTTRRTAASLGLLAALAAPVAHAEAASVCRAGTALTQPRLVAAKVPEVVVTDRRGFLVGEAQRCRLARVPAAGRTAGLRNFSVAANARGDMVIVWERRPSRASQRREVWALVRAGGRWRAPRLLSALGTSAVAEAREPKVALDAAGTATVAWTQPGAPAGSQWTYAVAGARWSRAGGWTATGAVWPAAGAPGVAQELLLAGNASGSATAVWTASDPAGARSLMAATYDPSSKAWSTPVRVDADDAPATTFAAVAGGQVRAQVTWAVPPGAGGPARIVRRHVNAAGIWPIELVAPVAPSMALPLNVQVASAGGWDVVTWVEGTSGRYRLRAAVSARGRTAGLLRLRTLASGYIGEHTTAVSRTGVAFVAWARQASSRRPTAFTALLRPSWSAWRRGTVALPVAPAADPRDLPAGPSLLDAVVSSRGTPLFAAGVGLPYCTAASCSSGDRGVFVVR